LSVARHDKVYVPRMHIQRIVNCFNLCCCFILRICLGNVVYATSTPRDIRAKFRYLGDVDRYAVIRNVLGYILNILPVHLTDYYVKRHKLKKMDMGVDTWRGVKNGVFWDIKTQFVLHRRHITSPLQSPAS
jgi:hypothetical protein